MYFNNVSAHLSKTAAPTLNHASDMHTIYLMQGKVSVFLKEYSSIV